jgi:hypothetical protein
MLMGTHDRFRQKINILLREKELKISSHIGELHGEILALHGHGEDAFKIVDRAFPTQREQRDFLSLHIGGFEKGKSLNMIPVEVGECDENGLFSKGLVLHDLPAKVPYSCAGIDNANIYRVVRGDEDAAGAPAELVELSSVDRNGAATSIDHDPDFIVAVCSQEQPLFDSRLQRLFPSTAAA